MNNAATVHSPAHVRSGNEGILSARRFSLSCPPVTHTIPLTRSAAGYRRRPLRRVSLGGNVFPPPLAEVCRPLLTLRRPPGYPIAAPARSRDGAGDGVPSAVTPSHSPSKRGRNERRRRTSPYPLLQGEGDGRRRPSRRPPPAATCGASRTAGEEAEGKGARHFVLAALGVTEGSRPGATTRARRDGARGGGRRRWEGNMWSR